MPRRVDPLERNHKYALVKHLSEGAAGFVVLAEHRDSRDQVRPCASAGSGGWPC